MLSNIKLLSLILVNLILILVDNATSKCTDEACSKACNLPCLNDNAPGRCDKNLVNPLIDDDPSCVCDNCPKATLCDFVNPANFDGTCVGPPLSSKFCDPKSCPGSDTSGNMYFPHVCNRDKEPICICMCASGLDTNVQSGFKLCPWKAAFGFFGKFF